MKFCRYFGWPFTNTASHFAADVIIILLFTTTGVCAASDTSSPIPIAWEQSYGDEQ